MIYTYDEAVKKYKSYYNVNKAVERKELFKQSDGIYSDSEYINPLIIYTMRYPNSIVTLDSAFYYYGLTDVIPQKIFLATDEKSRSIKDDKVKQLFISKRIRFQGCTDVEIQGHKVKMYDKERLLVEIMRRRNRIPFDYYKEIVLSYREIANDLDMYKIEEYISLYKNEASIFDAMQREVF